MSELLEEQNQHDLEMFTCRLYGAKDDRQSLTAYRYRVVEKVYSPKPRAENPLHKLKGIDGCRIPPCQSELVPHMQRSRFVARMWA